jgi:hypothetical protein
MSIIVVNLQDNRDVFRIFIALLRFFICLYLFVSSVLFVFWYHSPDFLDTPRNNVSRDIN